MYYVQNGELGSIFTKLKKNKSLWKGVRNVIDTVVSVAAASQGIPIDASAIRGAGAGGSITASVQEAAAQVVAAQVVASTDASQTQHSDSPKGTFLSNVPIETIYVGAAALALLFMMKK